MPARPAGAGVKIDLKPLFLGLGLLAAQPGLAHHSYAMFDRDKKLTLTGTVKEVQWTNPHCFIQLLVPASSGSDAQATEWSVEMGAPAQLIRSGWKHDTLNPGDKITVVLYPLRDGANGGGFVSASWPDGKTIGSAP